MNPDKQRIAIAEACGVGMRFGRLLVVGAAKTLSARNKRWACKCDCGVEKVVGQGELTSGKTKSCGCFRRELTAKNKTIHGNARRKQHTKEYRIWRGMLSRCTNPNTPCYQDSTTQPTPEPCKKNDPVFLTDTPAPTPRTDANRWDTLAGAMRCKATSPHAYVPADFARTLERELAAKDAEIARRKAQLDMWTSAAMDGNAAITQLTTRAEKAEASLATSVAFVARLQERQRELMKEAGDLWHERDQLRAALAAAQS